METYTTNYGLIKPDRSDPILVGQLNENMDKIDTALAKQKAEISANSEAVATETASRQEADSRLTAETAMNRSTLGYQRKNLLLNNCKLVNNNGVTATVNEDKSITLTGSNTTGKDFMLYTNMQTGSGSTSGQFLNNKKWIPNGTYIVSGSIAGVSIQVRLAEEDNSAGSSAYSNNGNETEFTVIDAYKYVWTRILITANADFGSEGKTIYPMIRPAEITDNTYEPYKPSVEERLAALEAALAAAESGA